VATEGTGAAEAADAPAGPVVSSVRDALSAATDALEAAGVPTPRLDAEVLLSEASGIDRARLAADSTLGVPGDVARAFGAAIRRRIRREPVAYITGRKGFRHIEVAVDSRVLIPRPETELLVEIAHEVAPRTVLDVGTGSGAVALAIAAEIPAANVVASEISSEALTLARDNAWLLGVDERVEFFEGSVPPVHVDLAVANLPYVTENEWDSLEPEIRDWEPRGALVAGADGLDTFRTVIPALDATVIAVEVGAGQAGAVAGLAEAAGFGDIELRRDLAGIERVVLGRKA